jgi:hypothetical protein
MKWQYFFGCILGAASLAVWPEISLAHGGGGGGEAAVTDLAVEVEDTLLPVVVVTHLGDSLAEAFVRDSAGRGDLLLVDFLGAEIKAALVTVVSVDAIATFAITAVSSSVLTSVASDFLIGGTPTTTTTDTMDILTMTPLTTMRPYTITGIGTVWPARSKRILPGVVITTDRLTE